MKKFIDASKKGAVVVSFGSNYRSDLMPKAKQNILFEVFRQLPDYHFVWKFESNTSVTDFPANVKVQSWLPVSDLLANSRVKAIFFHGGLLTTQEAIYRSVPMIIMPFALDQDQVRYFLLINMDYIFYEYSIFIEPNQNETSWNS